MRLPSRRSARLLLTRCGVITCLLVISVPGSVAGGSPPTSTTSTTTTTTATMASSTTTPGLNVTKIALPVGAKSGRMYAIDCPTPHYCVAGGFAQFTTGKPRAIVSVESGGVWTRSHVIAANITQLACPRPGACVGLGLRITPGPVAYNARYSSYLIAQHGSTWSAVQPVPATGLGPHPNYVVTALSCPRAQWCVMTGTLIFSSSHTRVFALTWRNGHWSAPHFLSSSALGAGAQLASLNSLSCVGDWCQGVGVFMDATLKIQPFTVTYSSGRWRATHTLGAYLASTNTNGLESISCSAVGACVVGGYTAPTGSAVESPIFVEENHSRWSQPYEVPESLSSMVDWMSCTTATKCAAVVTRATGGPLIGVATLRTSHHWTAPVALRVAGQSTVLGYDISCVPGQCTIAGATQSSASAPLQPTLFSVKFVR